MPDRCARSQRFTLIFSLALFLFTAACNQQPPDTRAADEASIRDLDAQWAKTAGTRDVDATIAFYSDDAAVLPPNSPVANNKKAIHDLWAALLSPELISITWQPTKVEVAKSGDLGYLTGTYAMTAKDAKGNPATENGKIVEVWKKQADGKWKCVADIFNSDTPAPTAPASK